MILIAYVCWGAFVVVWLGGYLYNVARAPRSVTASGGIGLGGWLGRVLIALAVILVVSRRGLGVGLGLGLLSIEATSGPAMGAIGAAILIAATPFTLWARLSLGTMWSSTPTIKAGHELRTGGPYAITRHPIYTGMLAMVLGTTLLAGSVLVLAGSAVFVAYVAIKIQTEERLLTETFGDEYRRFQRTTPAVVPFWVRRS